MKKMKKIILLTSIIIGMTSSLTPQYLYAQEEPQLTNPVHMEATTRSVIKDEPSSWAVQEIQKAREYNLIAEAIDRNYAQNITREEFSILMLDLYYALGGKKIEPLQETPFADTNNPDILMIYKLGILIGKDKGKFEPSGFITREEASVAFLRVLQITKKGFSSYVPEAVTFADNDYISDWAEEAAQYFKYKKIILGNEVNQFRPKENVSKEAAIVMVKRMYEVFEVQYDANIEQLKTILQQQMGKPYRWGGNGPNSFDCSGLVRYVYDKLGISLPRTSGQQARVGTYVAKENLQYGDIVCFARDGRNIHHVGIYVGNGEFVHAPQTGDVVKVSTLNSGYYARTFQYGRRVR